MKIGPAQHPHTIFRTMEAPMVNFNVADEDWQREKESPKERMRMSAETQPPPAQVADAEGKLIVPTQLENLKLSNEGKQDER